MAKIDLNQKVSKKTSTVFALAIVLFVIIGIIVAVASHSAYIKGREAKITKFFTAPGVNRLYSTSTPNYFGFNYSEDIKTIDIPKLVSVSKGATLTVKKVLNKDLETVTGTELDVSEGQGYFVYITVTSDGGYRKNDYVIQIERENTIIEGPEINDGSIEFKPIIKE